MSTPLERFHEWIDMSEIVSMVLATATPDGGQDGRLSGEHPEDYRPL